MLERNQFMSTAIRLKPISIPPSPAWIEAVAMDAEQKMRHYDNCAQSILAAFMEAFEMENPHVLGSAGAMLGGMTASLTCGVHTGSLMVLGLLMGRDDMTQGMDGLYPIVMPAQELIKRLSRRLGSHSCMELTGVDFTDLEQALAFMQSDLHGDCVRRVKAGAEELAGFLAELHANGEIFRPA